jgi:hypothetical protein
MILLQVDSGTKRIEDLSCSVPYAFLIVCFIFNHYLMELFTIRFLISIRRQSIACQINRTLQNNAHVLLLTQINTQNILGIVVAALSILITAGLIVSSTIAFHNAHAATARTSTSTTV